MCCEVFWGGFLAGTGGSQVATSRVVRVTGHCDCEKVWEITAKLASSRERLSGRKQEGEGLGCSCVLGDLCPRGPRSASCGERGWTQLGYWAQSLFQYLSACRGLVPAPHSLPGPALRLGEGSRSGVGRGVLLHTLAPIPAPSRCCRHCQLGALRLPGEPHWPGLAAAGGLAQALGWVPAPSGPSCALAGGSCHSSWLLGTPGVPAAALDCPSVPRTL